MAFKLGQNAKLYRNTGTFASPTWTEISNVKDLDLSLEKDKSEVTTRGGGGWKLTVATLKDAKIEFEMIWDTADAAFTAIRNSFLNDTVVEFLVLDGPVGTSGNQGLRAECMVASFTRSEKLTEALMVKVSTQPTYSTNGPPTWYTVP